MTPAFSIKFHTECHAVRASSRKPCPYEHSSFAVWLLPANVDASPLHRASRRAWYMSALLLLRCQEVRSRRCDSSFLDWQEHTEIDLAAKLFEEQQMISGFPMRKLSLAPVTLKDLERLKNSTPTSRAPGVARKLPPSTPSKIMSLYALSWMIKILYFFANATISSYKSWWWQCCLPGWMEEKLPYIGIC